MDMTSGVPPDRIYVDEGMTGTNRLRPGLDQALAVSSVATAELMSDSRSLREAALDAIAPMLTDSAGSGLLAVSREATGWYGDNSRLEVDSRQIEKDARLKADGGGVQEYTWHFVASARSGSIGAPDELLALLESHGVRYVIHLP